MTDFTVRRFGALTDQEIEVTQSALEEYVDGWTDESYRECCKALAAEVAAEERQRPALVAKIAEADNFDAVTDQLRQIADAEGGEMFLGWPERWWANPHWRCEQDHVSTRVLRSEALGRDACLACRSPLTLTFPEDRDGPLTD